jgi:methylmalonyl-CoA mutase cobalamin-binding domain/chain
MSFDLSRPAVLPETDLPDAQNLIETGRSLASSVQVGASRFLEARGVESETAYKRLCADRGQLMFHAQIGWRDPALTAENMALIESRVAAEGGKVDRYGICLDWSMGYPSGERDGRQRGTGLMLSSADDFRLLSDASTVAPHFGDFVIGMPAALENTVAALQAGATAIGNLGQYFTFRLPDWDDDIEITARSVEAIALCAAQPVDILIHSNLDDGFAARFSDLACALGAVLIERYIVEDLLGGTMGHCYGHTFSNLDTRQAFQLALSETNGAAPGTMIYGNTTAFTDNQAASYAALAAYLSADIASLRTTGTGHALTPIPVTEAVRIPSVDEIIDAQIFASRLVERLGTATAQAPSEDVVHLASRIRAGGENFYQLIMKGLEEAGYDIQNPFEMLLALRRIGAAELERAFGPGEVDTSGYYGRAPLVASSVIDELAAQACDIVGNLDPLIIEKLKTREPRICVATTDVHEYGKRLVEQVLDKIGVSVIDGGVSTDADDLAKLAHDMQADAIAVSTYNGVASPFVERLTDEMRTLGSSIDVYIGGRLNVVPDGSNTGIPVDDMEALQKAGAMTCERVEDMLIDIANKVEVGS